MRVIACLAEGLGIRATARVFAVAPNTVLHWLVEAAEQWAAACVAERHADTAELYKYATHLRSLTQGRGMHREKFSHYEEVPRELAEKGQFSGGMKRNRRYVDESFGSALTIEPSVPGYLASLLLPRDVALESVTGFGAKNEELERFDLRFYQARWEESVARARASVSLLGRPARAVPRHGSAEAGARSRSNPGRDDRRTGRR